MVNMGWEFLGKEILRYLPDKYGMTVKRMINTERKLLQDDKYANK